MSISFESTLWREMPRVLSGRDGSGRSPDFDTLSSAVMTTSAKPSGGARGSELVEESREERRKALAVLGGVSAVDRVAEMPEHLRSDAVEPGRSIEFE